MTGGFYFSKTDKDDVSMNKALEKIVKQESRSKSDVIKSLIWVGLAALNKKMAVVPASEIPANNPLQKIISARA